MRPQGKTFGPETGTRKTGTSSEEMDTSSEETGTSSEKQVPVVKKHVNGKGGCNSNRLILLHGKSIRC